MTHNTTSSYKKVDQRNRPCDPSEETRAACRRDCIKLRNHSNLNKAVGRVPAAFVFLIRWCFWVKFFGCRGRCVRDLVRDTILCTFFAI